MRYAKRTMGLLALAMGISSQPLHAQDPAEDVARMKTDIARLKREVARAEADARRTDSLTRDEAATLVKNQERWQRERDRRGKEIEALNARVEATRAQINAEHARMQGYVNAGGEIKAREKSLLEFLSGIDDSLGRRVDAGLPWDSESRKDRLLSLKRDIEAGSATPEEAFARLAAVLKEEIKSGDEIGLFNRPLTRQNGEVINSQMLKLGNQVLAYVDDEGKKFGILELNPDGKYAWRETLSFAEQNAVKLALAVKAGRQPPQLVPLPVSLSLNAANGKGGRP